jgi:hypothetical protein
MEDREEYLKKMAEIRAEREQKVLGLSAPLQNSIEIGETSKGELYVKSLKRYCGSYEEDWQYALQQLFAMYDEAKKQIQLREK